MRAILWTSIVFAAGIGAYALVNRQQPPPSLAAPIAQDVPDGMDVAIFGNGCFWCTEAVFKQLKGVSSVTSGYIGGATENPTYHDICTGLTGHAEAVRVVFDPKVISYKELLEVFFLSHDPTTLNRQGNDVGTQYRSVVFYVNEEQKSLAEQAKKALDESGAFRSRIVTEIAPAAKFFRAENYHQDYFAAHGREPYCEVIIAPKIEKVRAAFRDKVRSP